MQPTYRITYVDADASRTTRDIYPYKSGVTVRAFEAWCSLREDRRSFIFARIDSAVDLATGEVLTCAGFYDRIRPSKAAGAWVRGNPAGRVCVALTVFCKREFRKIGSDERTLIASGMRRCMPDEQMDEGLASEMISDVTDWHEWPDVLKPMLPTEIAVCRNVALAIVRGTGRKPPAPALLSRIDDLFPT